MKLNLVKFLACPLCKSGLECEVNLQDTSLPWTEIMEGTLSCTQCSHRYPINKGVPRLFTGQLTPDVQVTVDGFGYEWESFNDQIQDTYMTDAANFLDFIKPISAEFFQDKIVLDAGCGMGRFLKLGAEFGSRMIIGVDLSNAVDVAYEHTRHLPNAHVIQADLTALPLHIQFDYIFSVGVLQFLENPQWGFSKLVDWLHENGHISIWVYSRENNLWAIKVVSPIRKYITSRLPHPLLYRLSYLFGFMIYSCIQLIYRPTNESRIGQKLNLSKALPYNEYLYYSSRLTKESVASVIFDHLAPRLTTYISREQLQHWMQSNNLTDITISSRNDMSWRVTGTLQRKL